MAVRNFWLEVDIDGRANTYTGGPQSKEGGFDAVIKIREGGGILTALTIMGRADSDGVLTLTVSPDGRARVTEFGGLEIKSCR